MVCIVVMQILVSVFEVMTDVMGHWLYSSPYAYDIESIFVVLMCCLRLPVFCIFIRAISEALNALFSKHQQGNNESSKEEYPLVVSAPLEKQIGEADRQLL